MLDYKQGSDPRPPGPALVVLAIWAACSLGCSQRTLAVVDLCPNGNIPACASRIDAPVQFDASDAPVESDASATTLREGLVALWHFDETAGDTAFDSSMNKNDGTLVGLDSTTAWVPGHLGGALQIGGAGFVFVPLTSSIASIVSEVTVSAWMYWEGAIPVDFGTALSRQIGATIQQYYHLSIHLDGSPTFFLGTTAVPSAKATTSSPVVQHLAWTHLAATYNGSTAILYVDGVLVASISGVTGTFPTDTTPIILGGNGNLGVISERFPGRIDEIALYNRALDGNEIQQLASGATF